MTANQQDQTTAAADGLAAVSSFVVLKKRADFVRTSRAKWTSLPGLTLQGRNRGEGIEIRVGFTCSKKVGNAVARNRAKRRLREVARLILPSAGREGWDYVLIGKRDATAARPFEALCDDLRRGLSKVHE